MPVRSAEITARQGIPRRYLEPVLQELVRHGILVGIRGPSGGYRLARERRRISLGDIVRTVRALETAEDPISDPAGSALGHQVVRPLWLELQEEMMRRLDALTLDDLCTRAHQSRDRRPQRPKSPISRFEVCRGRNLHKSRTHSGRAV